MTDNDWQKQAKRLLKRELKEEKFTSNLLINLENYEFMKATEALRPS
jgi:hypothetical protein